MIFSLVLGVVLGSAAVVSISFLVWAAFLRIVKELD